MSTAFGQTKTIKGKLADTLYKELLAGATISVLNMPDSSVTAYSLSDSKGAFEVKGIDTGSYGVFITFQGYQNFSKHIRISSSQSVLDMGIIYLEKNPVC